MNKKIPEGFSSVTPMLLFKDARKAIDFYKRAFGATELYRIGEPGMIGHAELKLGNTIFMLADEHPSMDTVGPETLGGTPLTLMFYVDDVDAFTEKAVAEGLEVIRPVADQFYGDRSAGVRDACGNQWWIATHKEDVPPEELKRRAEAAMKQ